MNAGAALWWTHIAFGVTDSWEDDDNDSNKDDMVKRDCNSHGTTDCRPSTMMPMDHHYTRILFNKVRIRYYSLLDPYCSDYMRAVMKPCFQQQPLSTVDSTMPSSSLPAVVPPLTRSPRILVINTPCTYGALTLRVNRVLFQILFLQSHPDWSALTYEEMVAILDVLFTYHTPTLSKSAAAPACPQHTTTKTFSLRDHHHGQQDTEPSTHDDEQQENDATHYKAAHHEYRLCEDTFFLSTLYNKIWLHYDDHHHQDPNTTFKLHVLCEMLFLLNRYGNYLFAEDQRLTRIAEWVHVLLSDTVYNELLWTSVHPDFLFCMVMVCAVHGHNAMVMDGIMKELHTFFAWNEMERAAIRTMVEDAFHGLKDIDWTVYGGWLIQRCSEMRIPQQRYSTPLNNHCPAAHDEEETSPLNEEAVANKRETRFIEEDISESTEMRDESDDVLHTKDEEDVSSTDSAAPLLQQPTTPSSSQTTQSHHYLTCSSHKDRDATITTWRDYVVQQWKERQDKDSNCLQARCFLDKVHMQICEAQVLLLDRIRSIIKRFPGRVICHLLTAAPLLIHNHKKSESDLPILRVAGKQKSTRQDAATEEENSDLDDPPGEDIVLDDRSHRRLCIVDRTDQHIRQDDGNDESSERDDDESITTNDDDERQDDDDSIQESHHHRGEIIFGQGRRRVITLNQICAISLPICPSVSRFLQNSKMLFALFDWGDILCDEHRCLFHVEQMSTWSRGWTIGRSMRAYRWMMRCNVYDSVSSFS